MSFSSNLGLFLDAKSHVAEGSFIRSIFRLSDLETVHDHLETVHDHFGYHPVGLGFVIIVQPLPLHFQKALIGPLRG